MFIYYFIVNIFFVFTFLVVSLKDFYIKYIFFRVLLCLGGAFQSSFILLSSVKQIMSMFTQWNYINIKLC